VSIERVARVRLADTAVGPLAMDAEQVAFPFGESARPAWDRVGVVDLPAGSLQTVAHSAWTAGLINWVAVTGDWVAWVDQSHQQGGREPRVLWRVWALNLTTHERRLLSSNGSKPDPYVPQVHGRGGYFFWTQAEGDRSAREQVWRTGSAHPPRAVLRHTEMTPGSETLTEGQLVYLGPAGGGAAGRTIGGDCWSVPVDGSAPARPLTHTALAMGCARDADTLVWTEHIDPDGPLPADGVLDDPYQVHAASFGSASERLLHEGYLPTGYPVVGASFVAWSAAGGAPVVHDLASGAAARLPSPADGGHLASDGDQLVAYSAAGGADTSLTVVRISIQS
jgi:hypothetical protein